MKIILHKVFDNFTLLISRLYIFICRISKRLFMIIDLYKGCLNITVFRTLETILEKRLYLNTFYLNSKLIFLFGTMATYFK